MYHRLLEKLDFSRVTDRKSFATFLDACEEKGIIHGRERKLVRSGDFLTLLSSDLGRRLKASFEKNRLWREQEFILNLPANAIDGEASEEMVLVQGVIDAYLEEEDGILLIDYKTDRLKEEQEFTLRYEKQLHYYGMAIEGFIDKPVKEKIIWSFALGRAVPC